MLMQNSDQKQFGFTLVEMMFAVVVLAVLAALAMPNLRTMIRNAEIRNGAEAALNGLQRARAEAVARNTNVGFTLSSDTSWVVYVVNPAATIETRSAAEGSKNLTQELLPAGATTITYNNLGQVVANTDGSATLRQVDVKADPINRNLRIIIGISGNAKMCDPQLPAHDARGC